MYTVQVLYLTAALQLLVFATCTVPKEFASLCAHMVFICQPTKTTARLRAPPPQGRQVKLTSL